MVRFAVLAAVALAVMVPARATAQPAPLSFQFVDMKVEKDKLLWNDTVSVPVAKEIIVEVVQNGVKVLRTRTVTEYETRVVTRAMDLKGLKVTDATGKALDADKLAELLKEPTLVVVVSGGALPEKHRKLFKDTTIFIEMPKPETPKGPGGGPLPAPAGPGPRPPAIVPEPAPPIKPPPGEKKNG